MDDEIPNLDWDVPQVRNHRSHRHEKQSAAGELVLVVEKRVEQVVDNRIHLFSRCYGIYSCLPPLFVSSFVSRTVSFLVTFVVSVADAVLISLVVGGLLGIRDGVIVHRIDIGCHVIGGVAVFEIPSAKSSDVNFECAVSEFFDYGDHAVTVTVMQNAKKKYSARR